MATLETMPGLERWEAQMERVRGGSWPESIRALREEAFARFTALGFPTADDEQWRLTPVQSIARGAWELPPGSAGWDSARLDPLRLDEAVAELVFVNGAFDGGLSRAGGLPDGVSFHSIAAASSRNGELAGLGRIASFLDRPFVALNTALLRDGGILEIADGARAGVIHVVFVSSGTSVATTPRLLVRAGRGAEVTVVETHAGEGSYFSNAVTEIHAEEGSIVDHYKIVRESAEGHHVGAIEAVQGRDSSFRSHLIGLGGRLVRNDVVTTLDGVGAVCSLDGLYLLAGKDHFDAHTRIVHAKPHTESQELYKGILDGGSRGVFNGIIVVRPDAQKIVARQTNKNLLLSNEAIADSNPQLEIHANDVKCNHGSTIGQIDPTSLFYLRSRGIGVEEARAMLTYAFAREVIERMRVASVRTRLERILLARLPLHPSEGEGV
ncbi:MAG TPA: Fe-S cluster assembly protein SufD [Thermoanaerobaculia bacterium]|nr:Fe-S cluster assembly protein SufD [Thermoanaerobaculia bacterium]